MGLKVIVTKKSAGENSAKKGTENEGSHFLNTEKSQGTQNK
jgi:hypothetical protein